MQKTQINGQAISLEILPATTPRQGLEPQEQLLLERLDASLRANAEFQRRYPEARLERVDSMRSLEDNEAGRFYLRYQSGEDSAEFWGCLGEQDSCNLETGVITVSLTGHVTKTGAPAINSD